MSTYAEINKINNTAKTANKFFGNNSFIQPRLTINNPNDVYEQEADAIADKIMRMEQPFIQSKKIPLTQLQRKCAHCEEEEKKMQRKEINTKQATANNSLENYVSTLSNSGQPLPGELRSYYEPHFGYDFSNVKVHTNTVAAKSAQSINALAYTSGNNIVFNNGQYAPDTSNGKRLLAHELTHVVQQNAQQLSRSIMRQPDDKKKEPKSDVAKALKENDLFKKLPDFAQEKILDEIDNAPETITKAILDKIIDLAPIDDKYKEGLKKVGEGILKKITGSKPASTSICTAIPGYHEGSSRDFKGQCCLGTTESAQACCPKDRFAPNEEFGNCCKPGEVVNAEGKCMKPQPVDPSTICISPGKKDSMGKCCIPPLEVINGVCTNKPPPEPKPSTFSLTFTLGVIDDYNIDESVINTRQKPNVEKIKKQIHQFMEACPASMITLTGFADKPGTEEHNINLGQRRADHVKFLLQLSLMDIQTGGLPFLIFTRSEGEENPVDKEAGEKFSARNRRVEIEFSSMCPALDTPALKKPKFGSLIQ
jgi:hypothetical protein